MIGLLVTAAWLIPLLVGAWQWARSGRRWRVCVIGHRFEHNAGVSLELHRGLRPEGLFPLERILVGTTNLKNDDYLEEWFELKNRANTMRRELNA